MSKDKFFLDLTEREINLIIFLKESFNAVKVEKLQNEVLSIPISPVLTKQETRKIVNVINDFKI